MCTELINDMKDELEITTLNGKCTHVHVMLVLLFGRCASGSSARRPPEIQAHRGFWSNRAADLSNDQESLCGEHKIR